MKVVYDKNTGEIDAVGFFENYPLTNKQEQIEVEAECPNDRSLYIVDGGIYREKTQAEKDAYEQAKKDKEDSKKQKIKDKIASKIDKVVELLCTKVNITDEELDNIV